MDRRMQLRDRESVLREAMTGRRAQGRPPGAVEPALGREGNTVCPKCGQECSTPMGWSPFLGREEKMILVADRTARCPHPGCGAVHWITMEQAKAHNRFWFPEDPAFWGAGDE